MSDLSTHENYNVDNITVIRYNFFYKYHQEGVRELALRPPAILTVRWQIQP